MTMKKNDGSNYEPGSVKCYRDGLSRFLEENGYPKNILTSGGDQEKIPGRYAGVGGYFLNENRIFSKENIQLFRLENTNFGEFSKQIPLFYIIVNCWNGIFF